MIAGMTGKPTTSLIGFADVQRFASVIANRLLPAQCGMCRSRVMDYHTLCANCWSKLEFIAPPRCERSGVPLPFDTGSGAVAPAALADPPVWDRARAVALFDEHSSQLVHALKYRDRQDVAIMMARLMANAGSDILKGCDWVVPVPLYRWRLWSRRFNQAALLAHKIAGHTQASYQPGVLARPTQTRSQVGLDHAARWRNVKNAFAIDPANAADLAGRRIVLIDDVITTGATAGACAIALKKAGAGRVDVLAFALVQNPFKAHI